MTKLNIIVSVVIGTKLFQNVEQILLQSEQMGEYYKACFLYERCRLLHLILHVQRIVFKSAFGTD